MRGLHRLYRPVLEFALANRIVTLGGAALLFALAAIALPSLGLEFLPKLEEGNFWIRATMPPSISLEEANGYVNRMRQIIKSFPEVVTVISQNGRPDDGTDATGFFNAEFFVPLKPFDAWPSGVDKEKLTEQVNAALEAQFPGVEFNFSQYIEDNVEEAASGVKGENSVKLFGNDLATLEKTAAKIKEVMSTVPGITDLAVFNSLGQPTVRIDIDRARAARYGLAPGDINSTIAAAIGGQAAGNLYEEGSDRNFPMVVRLAPKYRQSLDAIRRITIGAPNPSGSGVVPIPLTDVANVKLVSGASFIYRENQERYIPIKFSVRGRDLGSAVLEAQQKIAKQVQMPAGYRLEWVGEFGELQEAIGRLAVVVPLSLALICMLLYLNFGSVSDMLLAASVMPMALIGGIFALFLTGTPFSVSAAIGFVALFGISAMDGIIVIAYFNRLIDAGLERSAAILRTCEVQMRPVVMTCVVACVGLLAGGRVDRHRLAGAKAAGDRGRRRHLAGAALDPVGAAGADRPVLPTPAAYRGARRRNPRRPNRPAHARSVARFAYCVCGGDRALADGLRGRVRISSDLPRRTSTGYTPQPLAEQTSSADVTGGEAQRFVQGLDIPGQWWALFHSAPLNALIEQALKNNPTLPAARRRCARRWENVYAQEGAFFPTAVASYSPSRNKTATGVVFRQPPRAHPFSPSTPRRSSSPMRRTCSAARGAQVEVADGDGRIPALPARSGLSDLDLERGRRGGAGGVVARPDRGDRGDHQDRDPIARASCASNRARPGGGGRCGGPGSGVGAGAGDVAAIAEAAGAAARPADGADRPVAEPGAGREVRARLAAAAAGSAGQPAVEAGRAAPGHPLGRGAAACGQRPDRRRHRRSAAADHADRQCRHHRQPNRPIVYDAWHRFLDRCRQRGADDLRCRHFAA